MSELPPETPLWDMLDTIGLPFRETRAALIAQHDLRPCVWSEGLQECHLPATALLPGLSAFRFNFGNTADALVAPDYLFAHYRAHARRRLSDYVTDKRAYRNFADAAATLTARLGPGKDVSVSNTQSLRWAFGLAQMNLTIFPPQLQQKFGTNTRHAADPGSVTEASISIFPGWLPDLTVEQLHWLRTFAAISIPGLPPQAIWQGYDLWHRWPSALGPCPTTGYGPSADGQGFVFITHNGFCKAIPRQWLARVERLTLLPAKGSGGISLSLEYYPSGQMHLPCKAISLAASHSPQDDLASAARTLANQLALPLVEPVTHDC
ncbi:MAG: hypothetical protein ACRCS3_14940 [Paracoccaceae bacterium]